jgi:C2 domain-containing protein
MRAAFLLLLALPACGGARAAAPPPAAPPPVRVAAEDPGWRALATDSLVHDLCPKVMDRFVGLPGWPGEEGLAGADAGRATSAGRWWIQRCTAERDGDRLRLVLAGPGWMFLDRQDSGFQVRQYVFFDATATLVGDVDVAYDREEQLFTIWLSPAGGEGVQAQVQATGNVAATASSSFTAVVDSLSLGAATSYASDTAREQVAAIGAAQMRDRLARGMTITSDVRTHQADFMLGALPRGERPRRPYVVDDGSTWVANERTGVWPGGLDVLGPFEPRTRPLEARVEVEQGAGILIRSTCAPAFRSALSTALAPGVAGSTPAVFESETVFRVDRGGETRLDLGRGDCDRYLVISTIPGAPDPAEARILVHEAEPPAPLPTVVVASASTEPDGPTVTGSDTRQPAPPPPAPAPTTMRVKIREVRVLERQPDGSAWDVVNGPVPDVFVVAYRDSVLAARTPVVSDRYDVTFDTVLDQPVDRSGHTVLRFDVVDEDAAFDDPIGSVNLPAAQLPARAGEVRLALHLPNQEQTPSGWLVLWVEPGSL